MRTRMLLLGALGLAAACAPAAKDPVDTVVVVYNSATGKYQTRHVELKGLTDMVSLDGAYAHFIGAAHFVIADNDPALQAAEQDGDPAKIREAITKDTGDPVEASFVEISGSLVPTDFHTLNLTTTYYNLQRAFEFFGRVGGITQASYGTPDVYYFPSFQVADSNGALQTQRDNAYYFPILPAMVILPFDSLDKIPLAVNMGVIGHEFTHSVFDTVVFDRVAFPDIDTTWAGSLGNVTPGLNLISCLNEGLADFFGLGVTCNPTYDAASCEMNFIGNSLGKRQDDVRRLDGVYCLDGTLNQSLWNSTNSDFTDKGLQYEVGTVLASALWRATLDTDARQGSTESAVREKIYKAVFKALKRGSGGTGIRELIAGCNDDGSCFHLESLRNSSGATTSIGVLDAIVDAADDPAIQTALCRAFTDRFRILWTDPSSLARWSDRPTIVSCLGVTSYTDCQ